MDRLERTIGTSMRIPEGLLSRIENDVNTSGDFASRNDYVVAALRYYDTHRTRLIAERMANQEKASQQQEVDFVVSSDENIQNNIKG